MRLQEHDLLRQHALNKKDLLEHALEDAVDE